ncbi:MAG: tRNA 2-thiocytidine(32) synthetase TtcA [Gammaproteobacteria bacterium RIFOXYB2_FULL_38_6]|nr:MAG: tRNA 2-thiocytidine(32) synthetase TtcA [Gammaproteobacteria bacterium RIFOXYB2_FULL_38_6]
MNKIEKIEKKLLHYIGKAIADYNMIQRGDRVLVCVSGGKDSLTLLKLLYLLELRTNHKFTLSALVVDQGQPEFDVSELEIWLKELKAPYEIIKRNTYSIVIDKVSAPKTYCSLCSRLRRGVIYTYAKENHFTKIALGHHRDDLIESFLMSALYSGEIRTMPPKLLTDDKKHIVIRPMVYCQEKDIADYAILNAFPIVPCGLCNNQKKSMRREIKNLIAELSKQNPKIPSCLLNALSNIKISQMMDRNLWDFENLEKQLSRSLLKDEK